MRVGIRPEKPASGTGTYRYRGWQVAASGPFFGAGQLCGMGGDLE